MIDLEIIKVLETRLKIQLDKLDKLEWNSRGYVIDHNNEVTGISLFNCNIENIEWLVSQIKEFGNLIELWAIRNNIKEIDAIPQLTNLQFLNLLDNKIYNIPRLVTLTKLSKLNLINNELNNIDNLADLTNLEELYISQNQISNIQALNCLSNLLILDIGINKIEDISSISKLHKLTRLHAQENRVNNLIPLRKLKKIRELYLWGNHLSDITSLKGLNNLIELNLCNNKIENIFSLEKMTQLKYLYLHNNKISNISTLKFLKKLERLSLGFNKIEDISDLSILPNLVYVDLSNNNITDIPKKLILNSKFDISLNFEWDGEIAIFKDNPIINPPQNIIRQGKNELIKFLEDLDSQEIDYIHEAKIMIVGEPCVGKTTLMNKLFNKKYILKNDEESTLGIEVRQNWNFEFGENKIFTSNVWDFGGQSIQYMLHQFFLTSNCLYILVAEKRRELTNFDYWLNIINILGKKSPVIVLFNERNINDVPAFAYDEKKYKELFPTFDLQRLDVNLANMSDGRFDVLVNSIKEKLINLGHIGQILPMSWINIRNHLETMKKKKQISLSEYFEICLNFNVDREKSLDILINFNLLGIVLYFSEDSNLQDTLFLDPNWTVKAIYLILKDKRIEDNNGVFTKTLIDEIWKKAKYNPVERAKLFQLMLIDYFELCYKLPDEKEKYIIPLLLARNEPSNIYWKNNGNLRYRYQYPFMPKGIISRLIVRLHEYIDDSKVWREGVVFIKNNAKALVKEQKTKQGIKSIEIRLDGDPTNRLELLTLIREEIRKAQNNSFPNLPYDEMIPCTCEKCSNADEPEFYKIDVLRNFRIKKTKIQCYNSGMMIETFNLIDAVGWIEQVPIDDSTGISKIIAYLDEYTKKVKDMLSEMRQESFENTENVKFFIGKISEDSALSIVDELINYFDSLEENRKQEYKTEINILKESKSKMINAKMQLKLGIPLAQLTGLDFSFTSEVDLKESAKKLINYIKEKYKN